MTATTLYTDQELFLLIADGDESAFATLFHRYTPKIQPIVAKLTASDAGTKDIIQDIFLNLWINRGRLTDIKSPSDWIFRIVYNRTYTWLERRAGRQKAYDQLGSGLLSNPGSNPTEDSILFAETARLLQQAVRNLPPQARRIYQLSREGGLKNQEIADELGLSVQTVKNTLTRAAQAIKTYLAEQGIVLPVSLILYWLS